MTTDTARRRVATILARLHDAAQEAEWRRAWTSRTDTRRAEECRHHAEGHLLLATFEAEDLLADLRAMLADVTS